MKEQTLESKDSIDAAINVALPNTTSEKMQAIVNVSKAILEISRAINGINTNITISNNTISSPSIGISIK